MLETDFHLKSDMDRNLTPQQFLSGLSSRDYHGIAVKAYRKRNAIIDYITKYRVFGEVCC